MVSIKALQEKVSGLFYAHGLFCASHPVPIISLVIIIGLFICFPLTNLPLPGNAPLQHTTPIDGYKIPPLLPTTTAADSPPGESQKPPRWYFGSPIAYIQQIVVKSVVSPWEPNRLIPSDAFRAPLAQIFDIVEQINNFYYKEGDQAVSLTDVCLHVAETAKAKKVKGLLPEYKCLTISPANFWNYDRGWFGNDKDFVKTIFQPYGNGLDTPPSIIDILFGVPRQEMGVKKLYLRNRQRVVSYSITLVFNKYNQKFVTKLREKLQHLYPLSIVSNNTKIQHLSHIHYKSVNHFVEYTPLLVTYVVLFLYLYFSVRKIEMVKSKWGLALSAVVTVVASLLMSVSICLIFGLTPSLNGSEIFPYLVIIIGLENVLVVTKSVVSTPVHLDVKLRVAQGLSKEGWYIFKNLMAELAILVVGFFTFVPAIQEFCLFAVVGLLSDFFLQMFFYATILSIDIRRMELSDLHKKGVQHTVQEPSQDCVYSMPVSTSVGYPSRPGGLSLGYGQTYPRLPTPPPSPTEGSPTIPSDDMFFVDPTRARTPRRVKIFNFWARTRVAQRGIMVCVVVWIVLLFYKTGIVEDLTQTNLTDNFEETNGASISASLDKLFSQDSMHTWADQELKINNDIGLNGDNYLHSILYHEDREVWKRLAHTHWLTLMNFYNISLQGRYLTILPSIHLSTQLSPGSAIAMRHPEEMRQAAYYHKQDRPGEQVPEHGAQGQAGLPEHSQANPNDSLKLVRVFRRIARVPRTKLELALTVLLGIASLILLLYFVAALYRCMCSRNYAKWRSSWTKTRKPRKSSPYYKQIREAVPKVLEGHPQAVECLATDGPLVVSSCLEGQLRVWDSSSGECIAVISRKSEPTNGTKDPSMMRDPEYGVEYDPEMLSCSPPCMSASPTFVTSPGPMGHQPGRATMSRSWSTANSPSPQTARHRASEPGKGHSRSKSIGVNNLSDYFPDLSETIDTDFTSMYHNRGTLKPSASSHSLGSAFPGPGGDSYPAGSPQAFDFSRFQQYYTDHEKYLEEKNAHMSMRRRNVEKRADEEARGEYGEDARDRRSWSFGDHPPTFEAEIDSALSLSDTSLAELAETPAPPVWCLACQDNLVVAGCMSGQIEFWDALTGQLKYVYHDNTNGVTALCFVANRVIVARINGTIDFLELETFVTHTRAAAPTSSSSKLHNRGHIRQPSSSSLTGDLTTWDGILQCTLLSSTRAHQKPVNLVQTEGGRVVTASQDHTLKVFRLEDSFLLFTLHGHTGSVTTLFIDKISPSCGVSGAEDGTVRVWDLVTGSCVHKLEGHNGGVTSLSCTQVYIISAGTDDRLCVWERWKGHLMHKIQMEPGYCNSLGMLTSNLMVTGGQGCLYLWDISKGEVLRGVKLDDHDNSVFIRQIQVVGSNMIACDYGRSLIVIQFPAVLEKAEQR